AEIRHQHLREGRRMTLAVIERAGDYGHGAIRLEMDAAHLLRSRRRRFQIAADAEPAQQSALPALALAARKTLDVGKCHRVLEYAGKIAAVIGHAGGRLEWHFPGANEVALA